jgi:gamma-glutamylcyclotransferase (GGCT)/AIG2-like uncharacterized protein YtfP
MTTTRLFVYGTLKRGCHKHSLLKDQQFLGLAWTLPRYRLYDRGAFPCLVQVAAGGVAVQGELWAVDEAALRRIDEWEDAPHLFIRQAIDLEDGSPSVEAYFYRGDVSALMDCGAIWPPVKAAF